MTRPKVDAAMITAAATDLIDREGLAALSMRKLAGELGVPVMNLYHYVSTRDEVLDRVAEHAFARVDPPAATGSTEERLRALFEALYGYLVDHPGLAALFADRALSGPAVYRGADDVLALLLEAGHPPRVAVDVFTALLSYTIGAAQFSIARSAAGSPAATELYRERMEAVDETEFPALHRVRRHLAERGTSQQFQLGLRWLLSGTTVSAPAVNP